MRSSGGGIGSAVANSGLAFPVLAAAAAVLTYYVSRKLLGKTKGEKKVKTNFLFKKIFSELVWRRVGVVEKILIYPLKSGKAVEVS